MSRAAKGHLERLERGPKTAAKLVVNHGGEFLWVVYDDERGKKQIEKASVSMPAQEEFSFKLSLLVHIIREVGEEGYYVSRRYGGCAWHGLTT